MPSPTTILCIDDDQHSLYLRAKILEKFSYRVLCASSAKEGLELFAHERVNAVVLDYFMPDVNGAQIAWELKRRRPELPVLMLSSSVFLPDDARDVVDGFCAKIDGPVSFLDMLKHLLEQAKARGGPEHYTILHVDDNEVQRYAIARLLRHAGFRVLEAGNGAEALARVREKPDLVLLDVNLPDMDGFEICRRIKADPLTATIPVLHLTATESNFDRQGEGAAAGDEGYLTHPLPPEELVSAIRACIARHLGA